MDSPLLPTHRNRPYHTSSSSSHNPLDDPSLLADLSIEDDDSLGADDTFLASSPIRATFSRTSHHPGVSVQAQASGSGSSFRSESRSSSAPRRQVSISAPSHADDDGDSKQSLRAGSGVGAGAKATSKPRFSLFAPPRPPSTDAESQRRLGDSGAGLRPDHETGEDDVEEGDGDVSREDDEGEQGDDQTIHAKAGPSRTPAQPSAGDREDRLRESLYELRRMNEVFDGFLGALEASRGHNERLAVRVKQTSALLDEYTAFLGQAEHTQKLLSNPNWTGAKDDAAALEAEHLAEQEAEERRQREAAEAVEAAQRAEEEKARRLAEAERAKEASRGGVPGRGRGGTRGGVSRGRGSGIPTASRTGAKTPTTGIRKPIVPSGPIGGSGIGKYGHVASSGYGPPGRKS